MTDLSNSELYRELISAAISAALSGRDRMAKLLEDHATGLVIAEQKARAVVEAELPSEERVNLGLCRAMSVALLQVVAAQDADDLTLLGLRIQTGENSVSVDGQEISAGAAAKHRNKRLRVAGLLTLDRKYREEIAHAGELMAHDAMKDQREPPEAS